MKPAERQRQIAEIVEAVGVCGYDDLATRLQVSAMTIRRDVEQLARAGRVIKTLGGVQKAASGDLYESDLRSRLLERRGEKRAIARRALDMLTGPCTVFLDGGTSCLELARLLAAERSGLTVVTNSALACLELGKSKDNMTVGIGGQYDAQSASFVGPSAEESTGKFFVDLAFVSTKGLIADEGTYESAIATFHIKQIIARQSSKVVLLIDHSKFGRRALSKVLDISQISCVVTDDAAPLADLHAVRREGCEVLIAPFAARAAGAHSGEAEAANAL
ncbi:MAG: DeoR/GlpR transcriptional regulator [Betaproteobacteria bacterium]|nr:DeoR/GlpR transcriptional regulator [Betaproteobacteria bacterium]